MYLVVVGGIDRVAALAFSDWSELDINSASRIMESHATCFALFFSPSSMDSDLRLSLRACGIGMGLTSLALSVRKMPSTSPW